MLIAKVEKLNGNWLIIDFMDINSLEENIITNWVQCDQNTMNKYNSLKTKYGVVYVKEMDIQKQVLTMDSFIFLEKFKNDMNQLDIDKGELIQTMDKRFNQTLRGIDFMQYINYIALFNYFASKGIFITAENKEDKYIEILELDDESAIEKLEEYLSIQEGVLPFLDRIKENSVLKEDIEYSSQDEFEKIKAKII